VGFEFFPPFLQLLKETSGFTMLKGGNHAFGLVEATRPTPKQEPAVVRRIRRGYPVDLGQRFRGLIYCACS
jgi:hypothetical protein